MECLDLIMDPDAGCHVYMDDNAQEEFDMDALHIHHNEGAVVEFAEQMMKFKNYGENIIGLMKTMIRADRN